MPTIVGILTFISRIFLLSLVEHEKGFMIGHHSLPVPFLLLYPKLQAIKIYVNGNPKDRLGAPIAQLGESWTLDRKVAGKNLTWGAVLCP